MTIETLIGVVSPPAEPTYAFDGPWEPIEAKIGTQLPPDYKDLMRVYGSGMFMGFVEIYDPIDPIDPRIGRQLLPEIHEVRKLFARFHPHLPIYPQPGGLLVCGSTDTGEYIFWLTRGFVSEWPIVVWDHDCDEDEELELFECDLTDYLAGLISGDIRPRTAPEAWEAGEGEEVFRSTPDPLA